MNSLIWELISFTGEKLNPGSTYSALKSVSIENGPLDTKSKTYLELAMLCELLLLRAKISEEAYLKVCFNPKQFAVFCFHRGLTFCQPGSWLLICHWRNLGHDFYFLLGVWSVCVCSKSFRPEELIKATANSRVEAVWDSIQGSQENPLAPHSSKLCCTALGARVVASCPKWHVVGRWQ